MTKSENIESLGFTRKKELFWLVVVLVVTRVLLSYQILALAGF